VFNSFVSFLPPANKRSADDAYVSASSPVRAYVIPAGGDKYKKNVAGSVVRTYDHLQTSPEYHYTNLSLVLVIAFALLIL
jgi:hypothetical protein